MYIVRAARRADHDALIGLSKAAGTGFTSLALPPDDLMARLENSEIGFRSNPDRQSEYVYQLMLEDTESGEVVGCSAVKAMVGVSKPYWDFKIITIAQHSKQADRRFDMDAMMAVNDFAGCSEVGTLFVAPGARGGGVGRLVAQSRYLLMAAGRKRFGERVLAELRGVVKPDGSSAFFDAVSRPFFKMDFDDADRLSAASDNQFILDLMPQHLIYVDLLPEAAREVIGQPHPDGVNALRLLEWEGFHYDRYVDIFDGGPLVSSYTENVRTLRDSRVVTVREAAVSGERQGLLSTDNFEDFRVGQVTVSLKGDEAHIDAEAMRALDLNHGDKARLWLREE